MRKVNPELWKECLFDGMSDNDISFRELALSFYKSRVYNEESFLKTLDLLRQDVINTRVVDSKNNHPDLFKESE
jgi:hypothetical protein